MNVCFGLHGGLGNILFTLPAMKAVSRRHQITAYCQGDYAVAKLFARCTYVKHVLSPPMAPPSAIQYYAGQYAPSVRPNAGRMRWQCCGWPMNQSDYPHPEWEQILRVVSNTKIVKREDVSDWCRVEPQERRFDFGICPGGKPTVEWQRKRWSGYAELAKRLKEQSHRVVAIGMKDEVCSAGLEEYWSGDMALESLPEIMLSCGVLIGNDCGTLHLGSSLGLPTVMIFTATSPIKGDPVGNPRLTRKIWRGLECSPCQSTKRWQQCKDWRCGDILVDEVLGAALGLANPRSLPVLA